MIFVLSDTLPVPQYVYYTSYIHTARQAARQTYYQDSRSNRSRTSEWIWTNNEQQEHPTYLSRRISAALHTGFAQYLAHLAIVLLLVWMPNAFECVRRWIALCTDVRTNEWTSAKVFYAPKVYSELFLIITCSNLVYNHTSVFQNWKAKDL